MKACININNGFFGRRAVSCTLGILGILMAMLLMGEISKAFASYVISDDATGGDCASTGAWDAASKTCTIGSDLAVTSGDGIVIADNGITVDGSGFKISGGMSDYGVHLFSRTGVTIKNLKVTHFVSGIYLDSSNDNILESNDVGGLMTGIELIDSNNNHLSHNDSSSIICIMLDGSQGNTLVANYCPAHWDWGVYLDNSDNNVLERNGICCAPEFGLTLYNSDCNVIRGNNIINNHNGLNIRNSFNNIFHGNKFKNTLYQYLEPLDANLFNLSAPLGGNYWGRYNSEEEGCIDSDSDGFCDTPFIFVDHFSPLDDDNDNTIIDNLPLANLNLWSGSSLTLGINDVYWASKADYANHKLSIDFQVDSLYDIYNGRIFNVDNTMLVTLDTPLDVSLGDIGSLGSQTFTLKYTIPEGTVQFWTTLHMRYENLCGYTYEVPD